MTDYTVQGLLTATDKMEMKRTGTRLVDLWCCYTRDNCFVPVNHSTHMAPARCSFTPVQTVNSRKSPFLFLLITTNSLFIPLSLLWNWCAFLEIRGFSCVYFSKSKTVLTLRDAVSQLLPTACLCHGLSLKCFVLKPLVVTILNNKMHKSKWIN